MDQFLNCGICLESYSKARVPLVLQCGHTFCSTCLTRIKSCQSSLKCPIDRQIDYRLLSEIRPNIILSQLVDYHFANISSKCPIHSNKTSKFLCFDCNSQYCSRCIHIHIFHNWTEFFGSEKIFQYYCSRKAYLEEAKKQFEEKFHAWTQTEREIAERKRKMVEEVKEKYREKRESLKNEEKIVVQHIEEDAEKNKEIVEGGMRVLKESIWKIIDLLNMQMQGVQEALVYESECQKIQAVKLWVESPEVEGCELFL